MDYEREHGRIRGHATTRAAAIDRARSLLNVLVEIGQEIGFAEKPISLQRIATWFDQHPERKHPDWKSRSGDPKLHKMIIKRELDVYAKIEIEARAECKIELAVEQYLYQHPKQGEARQTEIDHVNARALIVEKCDQAILEGRELSRALKAAVGRWGDDEQDDHEEWLAGAAERQAKWQTTVDHAVRGADKLERDKRVIAAKAAA